MTFRKICLPALTLLFTLSACSLIAPFVPPAPTSTPDSQQLIGTAVAATLAFETQVAQVVQETMAAQTQLVIHQQETFSAETQMAVYIQQTLASMYTLTPSTTPTLTATLTPTLTLTPVIPMVSVSSVTNCRSGPGLSFELLGVLDPGETTEVLGRTTAENYWLVRNPDSPTQICWLWGQYAMISGNVSNLPVATPPPTPTPAAGFTVTYRGLVVCAPTYALRFEIKNTGSTAWESVKIEMVDNNTAITRTHTADSFKDRTACPITETQQDLTTNEVGMVTAAVPGHFDYNPTGHNITVKVTLYAQNGLAGQFATQTITVTP